jgi:hypothetical protein
VLDNPLGLTLSITATASFPSTYSIPNPSIPSPAPDPSTAVSPNFPLTLFGGCQKAKGLSVLPHVGEGEELLSVWTTPRVTLETEVQQLRQRC